MALADRLVLTILLLAGMVVPLGYWGRVRPEAEVLQTYTLMVQMEDQVVRRLQTTEREAVPGLRILTTGLEPITLVRLVGKALCASSGALAAHSLQLTQETCNERHSN